MSLVIVELLVILTVPSGKHRLKGIIDNGCFRASQKSIIWSLFIVRYLFIVDIYMDWIKKYFTSFLLSCSRLGNIVEISIFDPHPRLWTRCCLDKTIEYNLNFFLWISIWLTSKVFVIMVKTAHFLDDISG